MIHPKLLPYLFFFIVEASLYFLVHFTFCHSWHISLFGSTHSHIFLVLVSLNYYHHHRPRVLHHNHSSVFLCATPSFCHATILSASHQSSASFATHRHRVSTCRSISSSPQSFSLCLPFQFFLSFSPSLFVSLSLSLSLCDLSLSSMLHRPGG